VIKAELDMIQKFEVFDWMLDARFVRVHLIYRIKNLDQPAETKPKAHLVAAGNNLIDNEG